MTDSPAGPDHVAITDAQRRTLTAIRRFIDRHKYPPTMQELADDLEISAASAHEQVSNLVQKGYLKREPRKARGLAIVWEPDDRPTLLVAVPLVGTVKAGQPVLSDENREGEVLVDERVVRRGQCFALRISGESMIGAGIADGDVVIVRRQPLAENGEIVVALVDGEATVKRLHIDGDEIELRPENPALRPIPIGPDADLTILGKVVAVRRDGARPDD